MRVNLPVTQRDHDFPDDDMLVSITDTQGRIVHCNQAFVETSGFSYDELMGQPHNLIRHPDMPAAAFKDMWSTIGRGRPWSGIVKNRRKNGDHYWVHAHAVPIMDGGKPVRYMSVRFKPSRDEVAAAQALYTRLQAEEASGRPTIRLHAGRVRALGWRDLGGRLHRTSLTQRLGFALLCMVLLGMAPEFLAFESPWRKWGQLAGLLVGAAGALWWFDARLSAAIRVAEQLVTDMAGCNLSRPIRLRDNAPLESILRPMMQVHTNLRAIMGDVGEEAAAFIRASAQIAQGAQDLSARTDTQAGNLERTAASMEQLAGTVRQTADAASEVSDTSRQVTVAAQRSGAAAQHLASTIQDMAKSSHRIGDIVNLIEGIAFQTNILALNAAVESARAGEHGRGFAVVAAEVRALAQRSASAARDIKALIENSTQLVTSSTAQMGTATDTLGELSQAIARTGALIAQISDATREQALGIGQVNGAVNQLDAATQQNAALVDAMNGSLQQMAQRCAVLEKSVGLFRLGRAGH